MANDHKGPLDPPTDLNNVLDKIENHRHQDKKSNGLNSPLLTQSQNNVLTVFVTVVMTTATIALVFVAVRHFKLHALVAGLTLTTHLPITQASKILDTLTATTDKLPMDMPLALACISKNKMDCPTFTDPILSAIATGLSCFALLIILYHTCHPVAWYHGYKYRQFQL